MELWYTGLLLVIESILVCVGIYYEGRKASAVDAFLNVIIGRYALCFSAWLILTIVSCIFIQVRTVVLYINCFLLVVWFILYLKNTPERIRRKKKETKAKISNLLDEIKDGFTRK